MAVAADRESVRSRNATERAILDAATQALAEEDYGKLTTKKLDAEIDTRSWEPPNLFARLQEAGGVARDEMFRAFNMGVGMVVIAAPREVETIVGSAQSVGIRAWRAGRVVQGRGQVALN